MVIFIIGLIMGGFGGMLITSILLILTIIAMEFKIKKYKSHQNEFIKYLEDEIKYMSSNQANLTKLHGHDHVKITLNLFGVILQKYKEIIT